MLRSDVADLIGELTHLFWLGYYWSIRWFDAPQMGLCRLVTPQLYQPSTRALVQSYASLLIILHLTLLATVIFAEPGGGSHTRAFVAVASAGTAATAPEVHTACLNISKTLAAVGVRVLWD